MMISKKAFAGLLVTTVADFLQLLQSEENLYFCNFLTRIALNIY